MAGAAPRPRGPDSKNAIIAPDHSDTMAKRARRKRSRSSSRGRARRPETPVQRRNRTEKANEAFERHLERSGEGPLRTRRHLERMVYFGLDHLVEQMDTTPMDVTPDQVGLYMGIWFPGQFRHERTKEVGAMLDTLERWFRFLDKKRLLGGGDLGDYVRVLERRRLYEERFDTFSVAMNMGGDVEGHLDEWAEAYEEAAAGPAEVDSYGVEHMDRLVRPPADLQDVLEEHDVASLPVLADLVILVERLGERPVRLTDANRWLPRRELVALNAARRAPERAGDRPDQAAMPVLNTLVLAARAIGAMAEDDSRNLGPGPARAAFLALPPEHQYWGLVNAFWNLVRWKEVVGGGWGLLPDQVQRGRGTLSGWLLEGRASPTTFGPPDLIAGTAGLIVGNLIVVLAALDLLDVRTPPLAREGWTDTWPRPTDLGEEVLARLLPGEVTPPETRRAAEGEEVLLLRASVMHRPDVWREVGVLEGQTLEDLDGVLRRSIPVEPDVPSVFLVGDVVRGDASMLGEGANVDGDLGATLGSLGLGPGDGFSYAFRSQGATYLDVLVVGAGPPAEEGLRFPRLADRNMPRYRFCEDCGTGGRVAHLYCTECDAMLCDGCAEEHDEDDLVGILY